MKTTRIIRRLIQELNDLEAAEKLGRDEAKAAHSAIKTHHRAVQAGNKGAADAALAELAAVLIGAFLED